VSAAWREGTLTRAKELESLCAWVLRNHPLENSEELAKAIPFHLEAAREAAMPKRWSRPVGNGPLIERAMSNLDAAEAQLLNLAPPDYVVGQIPGLLNHVQRHLVPSDPRRREFERIAKELGLESSERLLKEERGRIVTAVRGASSAALREQLRVRSFRNVLVATIVAMTLLAVGVALMGYASPATVPLCFQPEESGQTVIVCPTAHSAPLPSGPRAGPALDAAVKQTARRGDLLVVEVVGLSAAAVAAVTTIRSIRGSSEPYNVPVALAVLKLPMGAVTAFLGLLLMRGQFVPGLSALDTSAQILAWALVFGYAQQLFTRLVDQQGHQVLDSVRGADKRNGSVSEPS
jgi:hypothetical protein